LLLVLVVIVVLLLMVVLLVVLLSVDSLDLPLIETHAIVFLVGNVFIFMSVIVTVSISLFLIKVGRILVVLSIHKVAFSRK